MAEPFDPIEVDELDESVLEGMSREEMAAFRDRLLETLDEMETLSRTWTRKRTNTTNGKTGSMCCMT